MKLQNEILKALEKHVLNGGHGRFTYMKTTGVNDLFNIGITDGHFIKFYHKDLFFINADLDYFGNTPFDASKILNEIENALPLNYSLEFTANIHGKKETLIELSFGDGEKMYINSKYAKYFENKRYSFTDYNFYAVSKKSPVFIKQYGEIIGLILPINYNRGDN